MEWVGDVEGKSGQKHKVEDKNTWTFKTRTEWLSLGLLSGAIGGFPPNTERV